MDLFGINWYCMIAYLLLFQSFLRFCAIVLLICVFQVPCCIWWWLGNSRIVICNNSDFSQPVHCKHLNLIKSEYGFQPTPWWTSVRQQVPHTSKPSHWIHVDAGKEGCAHSYASWYDCRWCARALCRLLPWVIRDGSWRLNVCHPSCTLVKRIPVTRNI